MANSVYLAVCDALSHIVSRRAAENIVRDALRTIKSDPDAVTAREMQEMLKGQVFARLQQIIPVAQARGEIKTLLQKLESLNISDKPSLSPEVLEGLEALRAEFAPYLKLEHRRVKRIRAGIDVLPEAPDPVRALNSLWAELDLLFNEIGPSEPETPSEAVTSVVAAAPMILEPEPAFAPKPSAHPTPVSGVGGDGVLEIADDLDEEESEGAVRVSMATVELGRYELPDAILDPLELDGGPMLLGTEDSQPVTSAEGTPFLISEFDEFGLEFELEESPEPETVDAQLFAAESFEPQPPEPPPFRLDLAKLNPSVSAEIDPAEELRRALEEEAALRQAFDEEAGLQSNASTVSESIPEAIKPEPAQLEPIKSEPNKPEPVAPITAPASKPTQGTPAPSATTTARKPAASRRTAVATKPRPQVLSNEAQELLIARFALEEGVIGVTISNRVGQVSLSRMREGSAEDLAGMSAATAMLLESQRSFDVFYTDLGVANVFIAPLGDSLLTVLADKQVNVGRVLSEVKTVKEEI
jgi:hypothetical protein